MKPSRDMLVPFTLLGDIRRSTFRLRDHGNGRKRMRLAQILELLEWMPFLA